MQTQQIRASPVTFGVRVMMQMLHRATGLERKREISTGELGLYCGMLRRQEYVREIFRNGLVVIMMMLYAG